MKAILFAVCLTGITSAAVAAPLTIDSACAQGVRAAYEAYTMTTYDAKYPDVQKMAQALDLRLSQQPFPANTRHAFGAMGYIARRLRDAGLRVPNDSEVVTVAGEYINRECVK